MPLDDYGQPLDMGGTAPQQGPTITAQALADPSFNAFIAQIADQKAQMAAAQQQGEKAARWAELGHGFRRAADILSGQRPDEGAMQAEVQQARQGPVQALTQQQAYAGQGMQQALEQQKLQQEMQAQALAQQNRDPNSPRSQALRAQLAAAGLDPAKLAGMSVDQWAQVHQALPLVETAKEHKDTHDLGVRKENRETDAEARKLTQDKITNAFREREVTVAEQKADKEKAPKPIPETSSAKFVNQSEGPAAIATLQEIHARITPSEKVAAFAAEKAGIDPPGAAGEYVRAVRALAPAIGAASLPLGKETPALVEETMRSLPKAWTTTQGAQQQFQLVTHAMSSNVQNQLKSLQGAGYSDEQVNTLKGMATPPAPAPAQPQIIQTAQGYMKWVP